MASFIGPGRTIAIVLLRLLALIGGLVVAATVHWLAGLLFAILMLWWSQWLLRPMRIIPRRKVLPDLRLQYRKTLAYLDGTSEESVASLMVQRPWNHDGAPTFPYEDALLVQTSHGLRLYKSELYGSGLAPRDPELQVDYADVESVEELTSTDGWASAFPESDPMADVLVAGHVSKAPVWVIRTIRPVHSEPMLPKWENVVLVSPALNLGVTPAQAAEFLSLLRDRLPRRA